MLWLIFWHARRKIGPKIKEVRWRVIRWWRHVQFLNYVTSSKGNFLITQPRRRQKKRWKSTQTIFPTKRERWGRHFFNRFSEKIGKKYYILIWRHYFRFIIFFLFFFFYCLSFSSSEFLQNLRFVSTNCFLSATRTHWKNLFLVELK